MICPHCKKAIIKKISEEQKTKILALDSEGYSCRDIEVVLGGVFSYTAIYKLLKKHKGETPIPKNP